MEETGSGAERPRRQAKKAAVSDDPRKGLAAQIIGGLIAANPRGILKPYGNVDTAALAKFVAVACNAAEMISEKYD